MDLARAGVRAQNDAGLGGVERIPHVAGRVVLRNVQQLEVVLVRLHVAAAINLESHVAPNAVNLAQCFRGRMKPTTPGLAPRQRHVNRLGGDARFQFRPLDLRQLLLVDSLERLFYLVDAAAKSGPIRRGDLADLPRH